MCIRDSHRVLLEYADDIIFGLKAVLKTTGAEKGIIVIEDNKPDAIELMQKKVADIGNMEVFVARTKYPQGAEKTLIKRVMGRIVPSGGLPADVGVVVDNISTVKAISDAIQKMCIRDRFYKCHSREFLFWKVCTHIQNLKVHGSSRKKYQEHAG